MRFSPRTVGIAAALLTVLIWSAFIVIARASAHLSLLPLDIVFARMLGAAVVLAPWGWWLVRRQRRLALAGGPPSTQSLFGLSPLPLRTTVLIGLAGGLLYPVLAYSGFFFAPAAHASVLLPGSLPLWTALLVVVVLGERIPAARLFGIGLILLGGLLVGGHSLLLAFAGGDLWKGDLLFMCSALCWSGYAVMARHYRLDAVKATIAMTVFATLVYAPLYLLALASGLLPSGQAQASLGEWLFQAGFQGGLSVVVSGITFTTMVRHFGPVRSTMMTSLVPGLSALGAVLLLGEPLGWNLALGLAMVTLGMLFGIRASGAAPSATNHASVAAPVEGAPLARPAA
jgi:drug/metabolite transporter (DMT)-like permease